MLALRALKEYCACIADDILVFGGEGTTYQETEKGHNRRHVAVRDLCSKNNTKLN